MSVTHQTARPEDQPHFWTLDGLASATGFSTHTIRKYIENGHVPQAIGCHPNGFNYDHTHLSRLCRLREERDGATRVSQKVHRPRRISIVRSRQAAMA